MLMATLFTLFFGLLFLSSKNIIPEIKIMIEIVSVFVIISSNILAIFMTLWDIYVRRKNIGKRAKKERRDTKVRVILRPSSEDEYDFHYNWRKWNISSDEDSKLTMNEILENLFSFGRIKRKIFLVTRKGKNVAKKMERAKSIVQTKVLHQEAKDDDGEEGRNYLQGVKNMHKLGLDVEESEFIDEIEMSYFDMEEEKPKIIKQ
jgi:hypothetical protein